MSAESITDPYDWHNTVIVLCCPMIEALQDELDRADWCHPGGAYYIRESLAEAWGAASEGRPADVSRHLHFARRKLDTEWWWWSRGGSDFSPERPAGERRPAAQWLPLDDGCKSWSGALENSEMTPHRRGHLMGWLNISSCPIFTGRFGVSE
jgi:hypothetical protein